ncbi:tyrosine-type recombinase/integrase [Winogradskyella eckloniae]|uniref:tyrosine-type recombinase/integrase n=1 Tax=Winogradskyella eckloniae TaxID=1089306 RepID=UPI001566ADC9|nr:tyrosine-type recombinase/integrase [Winogradskyella eckloniae]NRD20774.1 tyrosine-type recombinase/integrase [Winogradskyella eckloniae]
MSIQAFSDYLLLEKKYSEHTVLAYTRDIENFQKFLVQQQYTNDVSKVNYFEIRQWIIALVDQNITNRSINRKISSLNSYFKFLLKTEEIKLNPLKQHKALKVGKKVQLPFSEKELLTVLESTIKVVDFETARNHFIIELFYATGIRRIELVKLKISDIDRSNGLIKVLGKRNKERYIPLIESLRISYNRYIEYRNNLPVVIDDEMLFLTKDGLKIYEKLVYRIINKYFSEASTKSKCSPHVLRHSFATHLLNQGADLNTVKELLGHASLASTQVYTHSSITDLKKVHSNSHPRNQK